jgi:putative YphP/YqiW family bacilliredoxin
MDVDFNFKPNRYPEDLIKPMREDLTRLGVRETRTPEEVDQAIQKTDGTTMVIVNSVCGCAAGKARPGVALALDHSVKPDDIVTVFAGADIEATDRAREHFRGYAPSSPSIALMQNGEVVYMLERHQIEGREAPEIAAALTDAFDRLCVPASDG